MNIEVHRAGIDSVTMTVSPEEFVMIYALVSLCTGDGKNSPRKYSDSIWKVLNEIVDSEPQLEDLYHKFHKCRTDTIWFDSFNDIR